MTKQVALPRLLDSALVETARLNPASLSISLTQNPVSTADMTVELSDTPVPMRSWVELYTIHGSAGIFRVSQSDIDYDRDEQRCTLEHGLCALNDAILTGGEEEEEEGKTPTEWLDTLLARQTAKKGSTALWSRGTVAATSTVYLTPSENTLLDLLTLMMEQLPDYIITTDQSVFPWKINIVKKSTAVQAEGRLSRNLSSVRISYDDSDLCTRVYANGIVQGYIDADTVSTYGIVEQYLMLDENTEHADAIRLAKAYLKKRKEPAVSVEIDAVDLSRATGEGWDAFTLGKKFRLSLPAYGVTFEEWITGVTYGDVYGDPEHVTLTLANEVADLAQRMAKVEVTAQEADYKSDSNSSRIGSTARTVVQHETKLEKTDSYLKFLDDEGVTVWRDTSASVEVGDAFAAMKAQVTDTYGNIAKKEDIIQRMREAGVTVDASKSLVEIYASEQIKTSKGVSENTASIKTNAGNIELKVSKDGVISAINQTAEEVKIKASKINLEGYVTASQLSTAITSATSMGTQIITISQTLNLGSRTAEWQDLDVVTSVSKSFGKLENIALADKDGNIIGRVTLSSFVNKVTYKTRQIHFLGEDTDSSVDHTA